MFDEVPIKRKILLWIVSGSVFLLLTLAANGLGFLDAPDTFETAMSVIFAIWILTHVVLSVVITRVGRHPEVK